MIWENHKGKDKGKDKRNWEIDKGKDKRNDKEIWKGNWKEK